MEPKNISARFLRDIVKRKYSGFVPDSMDFAEIAKNFKGYFFSSRTIDAFLLHEEFKGVGFVASPEVSKVAENEFVSSIYYLSDTFKSHKKFYDLKFSDTRETFGWCDSVETEWDVPVGWEESSAYVSGFIQAAEIASLKRGAYSKYYVPTLIAMARSTNFSTLSLSEGKLSGTPVVFRQIIDNSTLRRFIGSMKGVFDVQCAILDECLKSLDLRREHAKRNDQALQDIDDIEKTLCGTFSRLPRFKTGIQHSKNDVLSSKHKETFLETIVRR